MFENKTIRGIQATRYIMSWVREGGRFDRHGKGINDFRKWLSSIGLSEDEIHYIAILAGNGKLELESSAKEFLKNIND